MFHCLWFLAAWFLACLILRVIDLSRVRVSMNSLPPRNFYRVFSWEKCCHHVELITTQYSNADDPAGLCRIVLFQLPYRFCRAFRWAKIVPVWPSGIIITLVEYSNSHFYPSIVRFLRSFDHWGLCRIKIPELWALRDAAVSGSGPQRQLLNITLNKYLRSKLLMSMFKVHVSPNDSFLSLIDVLTHRKLRYRSNDIHSAKQTSPLWQSLPSWHCTLPSQTLASHCHRSAWLFLQCLHLPYFPERPRYKRKLCLTVCGVSSS